MATVGSRRDVDYLLIGGGLASASAAEEIRKRDTQGSILVIAAESYLPYNRPPLSKEYLRGEIDADGTYGNGGIYVQLPEWYQEQHVDVLRGTRAVSLDATARTVRLEDGSVVGFRMLLMATGGRPRSLPVDGMNLQGVHLLRTVDDANAIRSQLGDGKHVVVVGSGFIGMETAASALMKGATVTVIEPQSRPWASMVSEDVSRFFEQIFADHGGVLRYGYTAREFVAGADGKLARVRMSPVNSPDAIEDVTADMAIVGVGIQLNTELATSAGLETDPRHGIVVDERLETASAGIFVAGDIAAYPDPIAGRMHFEHWDNAIASGQAAGANMAGGDEAYRHVPYFFSDQFDLSLNMLGYPSAQANIVVRGEMAAKKFTALYVEQGILRAALMINDDEQMDLLKDLIAASAPISDAGQLADPSFDLATLMPSD